MIYKTNDKCQQYDQKKKNDYHTFRKKIFQILVKKLYKYFNPCNYDNCTIFVNSTDSTKCVIW